MHHHYLQRALALAATRRGYCAPNPAVGAVIVRDGVVIGEGAHHGCGMPHAEVVALNCCDNARGATLYVTLEPCCHYGRTPPCTEAILKAGISRVVYGHKDPNPIVAGKGHQKLVESAVELFHISMPEIDYFYRSYSYWHRTKHPWVTLKLAMSLDGKIAGARGEPVAITGPELKTKTYHSRQRSDAILTTAKTVIQDNPRLDVRVETGNESRRLYILDRELKLSADYRIWQNSQQRTVFYSASTPLDELIQMGVTFIKIDEKNGKLDLRQIMAHIGKDGVHDLWVEAGGALAESLLQDNLVHDVQLYCAPKWLGSKAQSAFTSEGPLFEQFSEKKWHQVGDDAVCVMQKKWEESACLQD
ncbi:MAG: bifunctional diaminohydroxyphosphoribosylaminopyrimidine deaminase/5-amino-6-(5-phosphoribosylamino)uracil reductase RibD [Verrucomicrobia bacterium]|nr:bifunctional diaminohydroxyphosphoribosylaminopyrimidine deaminase/5-amino-6-(5-phosphoribosylamino)uracil reductase RibD [Verrucomicrobiota bacterium]MBS0635989.1 bifunctional diaminohydroxyphosphoribosylaminopyrimidine deaminase/5-amino-6-(5-phosphoribosylamino)uracil reductase RibD [Verrucomicrobiota bacterium]